MMVNANQAAHKQLSVELEGGPKSPGAWKKWADNGARQLVDVFIKLLNDISYTGDFQIRGVKGKPGTTSFGGKYKLVQIVSAKNAIEIEAQLGDKQSRWRYELYVPHGIDVVDLYSQLEKKISTSSDAEAVAESANESAPPKQVAPQQKSECKPETEAVPVATVGGCEAKLRQLEEMASKYEKAQAFLEGEDGQEYSRLQSKVERLRIELAEAEEELGLFQSEADACQKVLNDTAYQQAASKLQVIREILAN